ncbi:hypothetical protein CDES_09220 [Corynebacterium deserti GIMN1.010]|uniref:Membrane-associated protein n=1 Tax=Corynebacterium deserti GIMN1.010 TaxID=931089 RepID=A0A0M5IGA8_9CORY|nr:hypothetical protein [Corynebacterium deserti]ALC06236.1 hypothetical protein CDES_09220 [Corynebacterium deserti GIMN1.010]
MTEPTKQQEPDLPKFLSNPDKVDIVLFVMLIAMGIYSLCMIPLRAWLLTQPLPYTFIVGGYTSAVVGGANASVGNGVWWVYWLCTLVGALKFMPVYWLMGKRWGMEFIDMSLQYMPRAHKIFKKAVDSESTKLYAWVVGLIPFGYLPGPVPGTILNAVAGLIKIRFWVVMAINALSVLAVNGLFVWLGYTFGEQVLDIVNVINRYLLWITLGLLALMFFRARKQFAK